MCYFREASTSCLGKWSHLWGDGMLVHKMLSWPSPGGGFLWLWLHHRNLCGLDSGLGRLGHCAVLSLDATVWTDDVKTICQKWKSLFFFWKLKAGIAFVAWFLSLLPPWVLKYEVSASFLLWTDLSHLSSPLIQLYPWSWPLLDPPSVPHLIPFLTLPPSPSDPWPI